MNYQDKIVVDTNILFMSVYNKDGKAGKIVQAAIDNKIRLFAPISVKSELEKVFKRELELDNDKIEFIIESLPVNWIEREIYELALKQTTVKHKPDKPVEAVAIVLNCGIKNNKRLIDIDKLLEKISL